VIESLDPIALPLWLIALYAAAMYPLGIMIGSDCSSCCCAKCTGCNCCGEEYSRPTGFCCEDEWRLPGTGSCCGGEFRTTEEEEGGECCDDNWHTTGSGDCCKVPTVPLRITSNFGGGDDVCNSLARGKIILTDDRTTITAVLQHGGSGYARVVDDEVEVATVTIISLNNLSGTYATLLATIADDPDNEQTFGQITALTITNPGSGYVHWFAPPQDHYFTEDGECCGSDWRTDDGTCCNDEWYPDEEPCPEGEVFVNKSATCCGCFDDEIYDPEEEEMVPTLENLDLVDCPPCDLDSFPYSRFDSEGNDRGAIGRCCAPGGSCTYTFEADCEGTWEDKCCTDEPRCVGPCCRENNDGVASCEMVPTDECELPDLLGGQPDCESSCKGACCIDGAPIIEGDQIVLMTQAECDEAEGCWAGVGRESCRETDECRPPFTTNCCESMVSEASGLTFTQPRRKRCEQPGGPWIATVTGTTDSEIMIHGVPVGQTTTPTKRCPFSVAFLVCWDSFNIEPLPCETSFRRLDVSVCWTPAEEGPGYLEYLNYSGCSDITLWLGDCGRNCETVLTYAGTGVTVGATVQIRGDATIQSNGGALVFPSAFSYAVGCDITLTLDGTSTAANSVPVLANPNNTYKLSLKKTGPGLWKLTAASDYTGTSEILGGTVVVGVNTAFGAVAGAFGQTNDAIEAGRPLLTSGTILLEQGVTFSKQIQIPTPGNPAILGGANTAGTSTFGAQNKYIFLGRNVTLLCATGGTVEFFYLWTDASGNFDPSANVTVGNAANLGTVWLANALRTTGAVAVNYGTLYVDDGNGYLQADAGVTINGASATLRYDSVSPLASPVSLVSGTLTGDATISDVTATGGTISVGSGDEILIDTEFSGSETVAKTGAGTLRVTGSGTFAGTLNVTAGTLDVDNGGTFTGTVSVSAGTLTGDTTLSSVAISGSPTVLVDAGDEIEISGALSGTGTLAKTGTGTLRVTGSGTFSGTLNVTAGTLDIDNGSTFAGGLNVSAGTLTGNTTLGTVAISNSPTVRVDSGDEIEISGTLSGTGTLTKTGSGTLRIASANTFSGTLNVSAGSVITTPGGLAASATFTDTSLTLEFTADPASGTQYVLLAGPTTQTYTGAVTLTGTSKTATYNAATATLTIT
jgi:autotransporter-associated beta strand protein